MTNHKQEHLTKFHDFFSTDFINLYSEIKDYLFLEGFNLLNQETRTAQNDFIEMIYKNVRFEPMEEEDLEEEDEFVEF